MLRSSLSRVPQLCPLLPAYSWEVRGNKKREIVKVPPAIGARTCYLNRRSSGICDGRMSFLLSSFFAVPVSSTMGLPLHWVSSPTAPSAGASLSWAPAVLGLFHAEVLSARLNPSHGNHRCHASVCSSVLCLVTTKIWSNGH